MTNLTELEASHVAGTTSGGPWNVLLDGALLNALATLLVPVDAYLHVQQIVDAVGALDHLQRSLHAATGKKQRVHRAKRRLRVIRRAILALTQF